MKRILFFLFTSVLTTTVFSQKLVTEPIKLGFSSSVWGHAFAGTYQFYYDDNDEKVKHGNLIINEKDQSTGETVALTAVYKNNKLNGAFTFKHYDDAFTTNNVSVSGFYDNGEPTGTWKYHWSGTKMVRSGMYDYSQKAPDENIELTIKNNKLISYKNSRNGLDVSLINGGWTGKIDDVTITNDFNETTYIDTKGNSRSCEAKQKDIINKYRAKTITLDSVLNLGYTIDEITYFHENVDYKYFFSDDFIKSQNTIEWLDLKLPPKSEITYFTLKKVELLSYEEAVDMINNGKTLSDVLRYYMSTDTERKIIQYSYQKVMNNVESLIASAKYQDANSLLETLVPSALNEEQKNVLEDKKLFIQQKLFEVDIEHINTLIQQNNLTQAENDLKRINCINEDQKTVITEKQKQIQERREFIKNIQIEISRIRSEYTQITNHYSIKDLSYQAGSESYYNYRNLKNNPFWYKYNKEIVNDETESVAKDYKEGEIGFLNVYNVEQLIYVLAYVKYSYILHNIGNIDQINKYKEFYETSKNISSGVDKIKELKDVTLNKCDEQKKKVLSKKYSAYYNSIKSYKAISNWSSLNTFLDNLYCFKTFSEKVQSICDVADTKEFETQLKSVSEPKQIKQMIMEYK